MQYKKTILAGGNGYLGSVLATYYAELAEQVIVLSRKYKAPEGNIRTLVWDGINEGDWFEAMEGAESI